MFISFVRVTRLLAAILFGLMSLLAACAPQHQPRPPGEIPTPKAPSISDEQYGHEILTSLSEEYELDPNDPRLDKVTDIVDRLAGAAGAGKDPWHVFIFKAPDVKNAAATRGNHVFLWSGLLDVAQSDDEIATFIAHEMAHVIAEHTAEDPSEQLRRILIGAGAIAAGIAVTHATKDPMLAQNLGDITVQLTQELGSGLLMNPYSREKELEADQIGLFLMADAKINPKAAINFWRRFQDDPMFANNVEFFSTHPSPSDRLERLERLLPQAMSRFNSGAGANIGALTVDEQRTTGDDDFDWSANNTKRDSNHGNDKGRDLKEWRVKRNGAILHSKPSEKSKRMGEFSDGAVIRSVSQVGNWVEILRPDHGYVHIDGLSPN